jgi:hypothetical protein
MTSPTTRRLGARDAIEKLGIDDCVGGVGAVPEHPRDREVLADVRLTALTLETLVTGVDRFLDDLLADLEPIHVGTDLGDGP